MQYSAAISDEDEPFLEQQSKGYTRTNRKFYAYILAITLIFLISGSLFWILGARFSFGTRWTNCGYSPDEARHRGCQYDVMIGSWLLPDCFDGELMEEYLSGRDWEFYSDPELTNELSMDLLRLGNHGFVVYATVHQHQHHCAYVWMKQFRAAARKQKMDDLSANTHHTSHCAEALYSGMPGANGSLGLEVKYFSCTEAGLGNLSHHDK